MTQDNLLTTKITNKKRSITTEIMNQLPDKKILSAYFPATKSSLKNNVQADKQFIKSLMSYTNNASINNKSLVTLYKNLSIF